MNGDFGRLTLGSFQSSRKARLCAYAVGVAVTFIGYPASAQLGNVGIANGVTSAISQVSSGLGKKFLSKDKRVDLQAERDKFFGALDAQAAGLDPDSRQRLMATMEAQWTNIETSLLLSNAQAAAQKKAPMFNLKQLALDVGAGMVVDAQIGGITGGATDVLGASAMQGVLEGLGGESTGDPVVWTAGVPVGMGGMSVSDAVAGATASAAAGTVKDSVAGIVGGATSAPAQPTASIKWTDDIDPTKFLGKHPSELVANDLYRENGFIGWKRVETSGESQIYAPVLGDKQVKAAVFKADPASGRVVSAFRVLGASAISFGPLVEQISEKYKLPSRYASSGDSLRAVWPNGVFLTADSKQLYLGWSQQAGEIAGQTASVGSGTSGR